MEGNVELGLMMTSGRRYGHRTILIVTMIVLWMGSFGVARSEAAGIGLRYVGCLSADLAECQSPGIGTRYLRYSFLSLSPDGESAYAIGTGVMASFRRLDSGQLAPQGCMVSRVREGSGCLVAPIDSFSGDTARISPDGRHVYQSGRYVAITSFDRRRDGSLRYGGCIARRRAFGCRGRVSQAVVGVGGISVSPDSRNVYVHFQLYHGIGPDQQGLAVYRQPKKGGLRFQGCLSTIGGHCRLIPNRKLPLGGTIVAPDGRTIFSLTSDNLSVFHRFPSGSLKYQGCIDMWELPRRYKGCRRSLAGPQATLTDFEVGREGHLLFVLSRERGSILTFKISANGHLTFKGCVGYHGLRGCRNAGGDHLYRPSTFMLSPSGRQLYVSLTDSDAVERYDLGGAGKFRYKGCISSEAQSECQPAPGPGKVVLNAISPDGKSFYFGYGGNWSIYQASSQSVDG